LFHFWCSYYVKNKINITSFIKNDEKVLRVLFFGRKSASSGDSKSINLLDFFLTRPDRDIPISANKDVINGD